MIIQLCCFCPFLKVANMCQAAPWIISHFEDLIETRMFFHYKCHLSCWCHMLPWSWHALEGFYCQTGGASRMSPSVIPSRNHTSERTLPPQSLQCFGIRPNHHKLWSLPASISVFIVEIFFHLLRMGFCHLGSMSSTHCSRVSPALDGYEA